MAKDDKDRSQKRARDRDFMKRALDTGLIRSGTTVDQIFNDIIFKLPDDRVPGVQASTTKTFIHSDFIYEIVIEDDDDSETSGSW